MNQAYRFPVSPPHKGSLSSLFSFVLKKNNEVDAALTAILG